MAIIQTINSVSDFRRAFFAHERQDQFSYAALAEIFEYLDECVDNIELDVIGICCEFAECTIEEFILEYGVDVSDCYDEKEHSEAVEDYLQNNGGWYAWVDDETIVFQQF